MNFTELRATMPVGEYLPYLQRRADALADDMDQYGPTPEDAERLRRLREEIEHATRAQYQVRQ